MKLKIIASIFLCILIYTDVNAVSLRAEKKYPYVLLSSDYGILNENDLGDFSWGLQRERFNPKMVLGGNYWQCFPRESIKIILKDTGASSDDFGWKDNIANLRVEVFVNQHLIHVYGMRRNLSIVDFEKRFNRWLDIMKGEKYVCLGGDFVNCERTHENGIDREECGWIFEKIKTKKGCDSYLHSCHPSYEMYLRKKSEEASYKIREINKISMNQ